MAYKAEERLYLNADKTKILKEGDPDVASLLAAVGRPIPDVLCKHYGLGPYAGTGAPTEDAVAGDVSGLDSATEPEEATETPDLHEGPKTGPQRDLGDVSEKPRRRK